VTGETKSRRWSTATRKSRKQGRREPAIAVISGRRGSTSLHEQTLAANFAAGRLGSRLTLQQSGGLEYLRRTAFARATDVGELALQAVRRCRLFRPRVSEMGWRATVSAGASNSAPQPGTCYRAARARSTPSCSPALRVSGGAERQAR
jgi:hypothetical protein